MNLLSIKRSIATYSLANETILEEVNIDFVPIDKLLTIVSPRTDDPLLYEGYILTEKQIEYINALLLEKIMPNFEIYYYVLECEGVYEN
jgi:hypothetical protein